VQLAGPLLLVGCVQALDLDAYSFSGAGASSDERWPRIGRWPSGAAGGAGAGGSDIGSTDPEGVDLPDAASLSPDDAPDAGSASDGGDAGGTPSIDPSACASSERCVPPIPTGWQGPLAVGAGDVRTCPAEYPALFGDLQSGLQVGSAFCVCGCNNDLVTCTFPPTAGGDIQPASCGSPNFSSECFRVTAVPSCSTQIIGDIQPSLWQSTRLACGQAIAFGACGAGSCYPSPGNFGALCIAALGEQSCPAQFPHGSLHHRGLDDSRRCGGSCSCNATGAACQLQYTLCSPFGDFPSNQVSEGGEVCLDPDFSMNIEAFNVVNQGTCSADGALLEGAVTPIDPVTVCCLD
jgi:hypothetical protein